MRRVNGMLLCREPECQICATSPEAVTVHFDCFTLFRRECKSIYLLQRLWIFSAWRVPWRQGPTSVIHDDLTVIPAGCPIPILARIPPELVRMIREYSSSSILWRFGLALKLAEQLSTSDAVSGDLVSIPLRDLSSWERGGPLVSRTPNQPEAQCVYLTIDSLGIKKLERIPYAPSYNPHPFKSSLFVIAQERYVENITARFKFGALRLELPELHPSLSPVGLQTWDTSSVPYPEHTYVFQGDVTSYTQFRTIDFQSVTGITFLFSHGEVLKIHAHSATAPTAMPTVKRLPRRRQQVVSWLYLPISPNDNVVAFGTLADRHLKYGVCFLFRLRLAGDVVVGECAGIEHPFAITSAPIVALIHDAPEQRPVSVIAAAFKATSRLEITSFPYKGLSTPSFPMANFSSASLQNTIRVQVFADEHGYCRGILLDYSNGARRALGQCRVGVDLAKCYTAPSYVCFRNVYFRWGTLLRKAVMVEGTGTGGHHHTEEGWICCKDCELAFWCNSTEVEMSVITKEG
ncbi:hypothetical protein F5Y13DRAFT_102682 [Hypoxylon sp. FL1857]|nr:hypothetical protein F5Y13DRAFT_102682 [Hypoxylon sp. FL1857]